MAVVEPMRVPLFRAVEASEPALAVGLEQALLRVIRSGRFILGDEVAGFECSLAEYVGARHAVGVSSGTDALVCALLALGVGAGDEVVTTPFTFVATVEAVLRVGARPVFVDVELDRGQIDAERVESALTARTRAVLPVHLFGHPALLGELPVPVVEDAAQALGAKAGERAVGTLGKVACFSFFPTKTLGGLGDAGALVTQDEALAERVRRLRQHGARSKHEYVELGGNYRIDALQAACLRVKLPYLEAWLGERRAIAEAYSAELAGMAELRLPATLEGTEPAWAHYVVRVLGGAERRDALVRYLMERGVETAIYYPTPLHLQPVFAHLGYRRGDFPVAERWAREALALPLFPGLRAEERARVVDGVHSFFQR